MCIAPSNWNKDNKLFSSKEKFIDNKLVISSTPAWGFLRSCKTRKCQENLESYFKAWKSYEELCDALQIFWKGQRPFPTTCISKFIFIHNIKINSLGLILLWLLRFLLKTFQWWGDRKICYLVWSCKSNGIQFVRKARNPALGRRQWHGWSNTMPFPPTNFQQLLYWPFQRAITRK